MDQFTPQLQTNYFIGLTKLYLTDFVITSLAPHFCVPYISSYISHHIFLTSCKNFPDRVMRKYISPYISHNIPLAISFSIYLSLYFSIYFSSQFHQTFLTTSSSLTFGGWVGFLKLAGSQVFTVVVTYVHPCIGGLRHTVHPYNRSYILT